MKKMQLPPFLIPPFLGLQALRHRQHLHAHRARGHALICGASSPQYILPQVRCARRDPRYA